MPSASRSGDLDLDQQGVGGRDAVPARPGDADRDLRAIALESADRAAGRVGGGAGVEAVVVVDVVEIGPGSLAGVGPRRGGAVRREAVGRRALADR
jgi:hypothetical protein